MIHLLRKLFFLTPIKFRIYINHLYILWIAKQNGRSYALDSDLSWNSFYEQVLKNKKAYKGIFVQLPIMDWRSELIQRPHHIAKAFAKRGWLVIYLTPNRQDHVNGFRKVETNVYITNMFLKVCGISDAVFSSYSTFDKDYLLVSIAKRNRNKIVYEYIDSIDGDISGSDAIEGFKFKYSQMVSKLADFVIASSKALAEDVYHFQNERKNEQKVQIGLVPNGVDLSFYTLLSSVPDELSERIRLFKERHSICVGFTGAIAPWLWYEMLNELIKIRPDVGFVFIGPDYLGGAKQLQSSGNLLLTGRVPFMDLPKYCKYFDVCIIPFRPGPIAECTSPLKLFEYFALEKPVVVTEGMKECTQYREVFGANNVQSFSRSIDLAFGLREDFGYKSNLRLLANDNSWDNLVAKYENYLGNVLH